MMVIAFLVAPLMIVTGFRTGDDRLWRWGALVGLLAAIAAYARHGSRSTGGAES